MRILTGALLGLLVGVAAGLWLGQLSTSHPLAFESRVCEGRCALLAESVVSGEQDLEQALADSWHTMLELAEKVESLELLVERFREQELDASRIVDDAISTMSDRELHTVVGSLAHLSPEELDEVSDMRAFAARLAEVAMQDTVVPGREMSAADRVVFDTRKTTRNSGTLARDRFDAGDSRIYAFFPTDHYERDTVMIKWLRGDRNQILAFERYPIRPGDAHGYVWLRPRGGWEPGQYQVDVYAADEEVTLLAHGRYRVE
jgi:hypothetical protein